MAKTTKLVPREGEDGIRFYVSDDALEAYKILRNGTRINVRASPTTCPNCKLKSNANRKQRYLQFKGVWRHRGHILASHAVHLAWIGPIPDGFVVDHLNGVTTDNRASNLQAVTPAENVRRAKLLKILRSIGRVPRRMSRSEILSFFRRYDFMSPSARMEYDFTHHMEC